MHRQDALGPPRALDDVGDIEAGTLVLEVLVTRLRSGPVNGTLALVLGRLSRLKDGMGLGEAVLDATGLGQLGPKEAKEEDYLSQQHRYPGEVDAL